MMWKICKIGRRSFYIEFYLQPIKVHSPSKPYQFDLFSVSIQTHILKGFRISICHLGFRFNWLTRHYEQNVVVEGE